MKESVGQASCLSTGQESMYRCRPCVCYRRAYFWVNCTTLGQLCCWEASARLNPSLKSTLKSLPPIPLSDMSMDEIAQ